MTGQVEAIIKPLVRLHEEGCRRPRLYYLMPLALWGGLILLGSLAPPSRLPEIETSDKVQHLLAYAVLGWLLARAWACRRRPSPATVAAMLASATLFGLLVEVLQQLTPSRTFDWLDAVANTGGAATGIAIWLIWRAALRRAVAPPSLAEDA